MDEGLRQQRDTSLAGLEALIRRGRQIRRAPAAEATRAWQQECATAIHQLSGGSKAHWLSRAFSEAFLVRPARGGVVVEVDTAEIVDRILGVLAQGVSSLSGMDEPAGGSGEAPRPRRFDFVRAADLRPVLERTFDDSRDALERGDFGLALVLACGILEAVITDALEFARETAAASPEGRVTGWPFETRIAAAESAGLIRGGCARLPAVARRYRELTGADGELRPDTGVSERDARLVRQVLHVVMRDLDPGR